jgi:hypothetical protein
VRTIPFVSVRTPFSFSGSCPAHQYVLVGDSPFQDRSSVQFRKVYDDSWVPDRRSPYTGTLFKVEPVTFPGFSPVELNTDPNGVWLGQNLVAVGYGTNSSDFNDTVAPEQWSWPEQALEAKLKVGILADDLAAAWAPGLGPCRGTMSTVTNALVESVLNDL